MSCVEDGVSHAETRIHMDCGGSDTSAIFFELLRDIGFPYKDCNPADNHLDVRLCFLPAAKAAGLSVVFLLLSVINFAAGPLDEFSTLFSWILNL